MQLSEYAAITYIVKTMPVRLNMYCTYESDFDPIYVLWSHYMLQNFVMNSSTKLSIKFLDVDGNLTMCTELYFELL